ncbi:hypothetical protein BK133_24760 [Paenibacillus sp. FSL H8-0548]|nr:hypothetical protein BK133_24760 [Paenibacillus sp. FSL H8-0548]
MLELFLFFFKFKMILLLEAMRSGESPIIDCDSKSTARRMQIHFLVGMIIFTGRFMSDKLTKPIVNQK